MNNYGLICAALILASAISVSHLSTALGWLFIIAASLLYYYRVDVRDRTTSGRRLEDLLQRKK